MAAPSADRRAPGPVLVGLRVAAAHHPLCLRFRHDVFALGRWPVCSGCAAAVPAFVLALPAALALAASRAAPTPVLVGAGLLLGAPQLLTYLRRFGRASRAAAKAAGGAGIATIAAALLVASPGLGLLAALGALVTVAFLAMQALRLRSMLRVCAACPWKGDWNQCPGFSPGQPHDPPPGVRLVDQPLLRLARVAPPPGPPR